MRVALLPGCAQQVLAPEINEATIRLLTRHGCEVVVAPGSGCCGALVHHLGEEATGAGPGARQYRRLGKRARRQAGSTLIVANASGCGTMLKDYGFLLRTDPAYAEKAARIAGAGARRQRNCCRRSDCGRRPARPRRCGSPIIPPARCSTARRSTASRRRCSPPPGSRSRRARRASVLRLGRHLQYPAAGPRGGAARPQARQCRTDPAPISSPPAISAA